MAKKSAPKRKADKPKPPDDSKAKPKRSTRTRKPKAEVKHDDAAGQSAAAGIVALVLMAPPIQTDQFSHVQITITLTGKADVPQCDIRAWKDDGHPAESSEFGNAIKPLLVEVMRKLGVAYPSQNYVTLGIDGNGGLIPTGDG